MGTALTHKRYEDQPYCPICLKLKDCRLLGAKTRYQPKLMPNLYRLECPDCGSTWYCPRELFISIVKKRVS